MPQQAGRHGAPRLPGCPDCLHPARVRRRSQPQSLPDRRRQRQIACRPDIGPAHRQKKIDVRRPSADPFDPGQFRPDIVVFERLQLVQGQLAVKDRRRQFASVARLLAAESCRLQLCVI
jgi:hypothetical protein